MRLIKNLPNLLTLCNLLLGCLAIVYIYQDHMLITDRRNGVFVDMGRIEMASLFVFIAAIIDFLDGFVARLLKAQSAIGKQLDSLADVVTFGVVPGLIMYQLIARSYYVNAQAFDYPILYFSIGLLIPLCAAWRLAKFNVDERQTLEFRGLPTPAVGLFIAALPPALFFDEQFAGALLSKAWVLFLITILLSYLMTSDIRLMSLKLQSKKLAENKWPLILVAAIILAAITAFGFMSMVFLIIPISVILYILISIIKNISEHGL